MAGRIRSIKPELIEDARTARLANDTFRLYVASLCMAEDSGVFRAEPRSLNGLVFSERKLGRSIAKLISELESFDTSKGQTRGLWITYSVRGQRYGYLSGWTTHQRVKDPKKRLPQHTDPGAYDVRGLATASEPAADLQPATSGPLADPSPTTGRPVADLSLTLGSPVNDNEHLGNKQDHDSAPYHRSPIIIPPTNDHNPQPTASAPDGALGVSPDPLGSAKPSVRKAVQAHLEDATRLLDDLNAARLRVIPRSRPIRPTYSSLQGIAERLASGATVDECVHVIAVGEAEVRADAKCAQWFDAVSPWRPENFQRKLARDPATVTSKRPSGALDPSMTGNTPDSWGF